MIHYSLINMCESMALKWPDPRPVTQDVEAPEAETRCSSAARDFWMNMLRFPVSRFKATRIYQSDDPPTIATVPNVPNTFPVLIDFYPEGTMRFKTNVSKPLIWDRCIRRNHPISEVISNFHPLQSFVVRHRCPFRCLCDGTSL